MMLEDLLNSIVI